jgi:proteasome lid subunit RPN8/RPN11
MSTEACRSIAACAHRALPHECCGVLVGREGKHAEIVAAWELPNESTIGRTRRFEISPKALHGQIVRARESELEVLGFFHSHPEGEARPSPGDIRSGSGWPGYINAIYACDRAHRDQPLRVYRTMATCWLEVPLKRINS